MKLIKTVIMCQECQMPYYKALWEPMWLAKLAAKENHDEWHGMAMNPETTPLAETWRKWERERIIEMLETEKFSLPRGLEGGTTYIPIEELIALIKGEQK